MNRAHRTGSTWIAIVATILILAVLAIILLPVIARIACHNSPITYCGNNLKQMYTAMRALDRVEPGGGPCHLGFANPWPWGRDLRPSAGPVGTGRYWWHVLFPDGPLGSSAEVQDYRLRQCPLTGHDGTAPSDYWGPTSNPAWFPEDHILGRDADGNHGLDGPVNAILKCGELRPLTTDEIRELPLDQRRDVGPGQLPEV